MALDFPDFRICQQQLTTISGKRGLTHSGRIADYCDGLKTLQVLRKDETMRQSSQAEVITGGDSLSINAKGFERSLKATNRSPRTIKCYLEAVEQFEQFLDANGMPNDIEAISREHVESYLAEVLAKWTPGTGLNRYQSLRQFFKWADESDRLPNGSPMAKMKPPHVEAPPVPMLSETEQNALLATCAKGKDFESRRDYAILQTFVSTGARLGEVAGIKMWRETETRDGSKKIPGDVDLDSGNIFVMGKGARPRVIYLNRDALNALDAYEYTRRRHPDAGISDYWLGRKGALGDSGIRQMMRRRAKEAGIEHIHPHMLRHGFAHTFRMRGGSGEDLQRLAGWRSPQMLTRYGASAADERARAAYERIMDSR